jgi:PAS domain S-box-containing protein
MKRGPAKRGGRSKPAQVRQKTRKPLRASRLQAPDPPREFAALPCLPDLKPMLGEIVDAAIDISGSDFGDIQLLDPESSALRIVAHRGFPQGWVDFWNNVSKGQGPYGVSFERGKRVIVADVKKRSIFKGEGLKTMLRAGVRAVQSTPIVSRSGTILGMFSTHYQKPHRPDQRTLRLLDLLARQAGDIIEQAQYRAALRQSEERYRQLAEQIPDGIFLADSQGRYVDANRAGCAMLGYTLEELKRLGFSDVLAPEELPKLSRQYHDLATGQIVRSEWRFLRKDRSVFVGELFGRQLPDGRLLSVLRDVSERKRIETEAQAVMDLAPVGIFIARDPQCVEITGNRMARELVRMPPESNLSKSAPLAQRSDSCRIVKDGLEISPDELPMQKAAATGQAVQNAELDVLYPDGERRSMVGNAVPLLSEDGRVRGAVGTFLDITALKEAEESFRVFVNNAPMAVLIHGPNGKIASVNSEAERLFGYSREEMVGQPVEMLMPESLRRKHVEERESYVKDPKPRPMGIGLQLKVKCKDGHELPVEINLSPIETSRGVFVAATVFDPTERKRLAEQTRLAAVLQDRARVARDLHDTLAQGFTGIIMNLEAAEEASANLPEEAKFRLKRAEEVARENLEEVRRALTELSEPAKRTTDLVSALRSFAERCQSNGGGQVRFSLRGEPTSLDDTTEENLLFIARQATDNALRHGRPSKVEIALVFEKGEVRIGVQDDGRGFNVEKIEHGLGLTSMNDRAQYIGGQFTLKSQPGKGTRVEVRLPLPATRPPEVSR